MKKDKTFLTSSSLIGLRNFLLRNKRDREVVIEFNEKFVDFSAGWEALFKIEELSYSKKERVAIRAEMEIRYLLLIVADFERFQEENDVVDSKIEFFSEKVNEYVKAKRKFLEIYRGKDGDKARIKKKLDDVLSEIEKAMWRWEIWQVKLRE